MSDYSYRELSRRNWRLSNDRQVPTDAELRTGALLRIADATEAMARRHTELIQECESMKRQRDYWIEKAEQWNRERIAQKGVATKLKKRLAMEQEACKLPPITIKIAGDEV